MNAAKSDRRPLASINITPLVDVLLILLVVMMLSMPLFVKKLPVELPNTDLSGTPTPVKSLQVSITKNGQLLLNQSKVDMPLLQSKIDPTVTVELAVDKQVTYQEFAQVIAGLQAKEPKEIVMLTN